MCFVMKFIRNATRTIHQLGAWFKWSDRPTGWADERIFQRCHRNSHQIDQFIKRRLKVSFTHATPPFSVRLSESDLYKRIICKRSLCVCVSVHVLDLAVSIVKWKHVQYQQQQKIDNHMDTAKLQTYKKHQSSSITNLLF